MKVKAGLPPLLKVRTQEARVDDIVFNEENLNRTRPRAAGFDFVSHSALQGATGLPIVGISQTVESRGAAADPAVGVSPCLSGPRQT
jgi:hypothetical protein